MTDRVQESPKISLEVCFHNNNNKNTFIRSILVTKIREGGVPGPVTRVLLNEKNFLTAIKKRRPQLVYPENLSASADFS